MATEAFLRGSRNKKSASLVLTSTSKTIQEACQRLKTKVAYKKAENDLKVSFQERLFSDQEEIRVTDLERTVSKMTYMVRTKSPHHGYQSGVTVGNIRINIIIVRPFSPEWYPHTSPDWYSLYRYSGSLSGNFSRSFLGRFAGHPLHRDGRYPSHSPSGGSGTLSGDRFPSLRESSPGWY